MLLGLLIVLMTDPQHHIDAMMSVIDTRDGKSEYLALPSLIVANITMCAGSVFNHSLMVTPLLLLCNIVN